MNIALLATPYTHPTCPPLGPAILSAYLQKNLPETLVSVFDLSLDYYLNALAMIEDGSIAIRLFDWNEQITARHLGQSVSFFRNWQPSCSNLKEYHHWATIFLNFENVFNAFMSSMAEKYLNGQSIPDKIEGFFEDLLKPVLAVKPDLVGFSILYQQQLVFAAMFARMLKKSSRVKIAAGGACISVMANPEELLTTPIAHKYEDSSDIFLKDYFDYLLPGEGELAFYQLCRATNSADLTSVPNLIYFSKNGLQINQPVTPGIDDIVCPDFTHFKLEKYLVPEPVLPVMTSRGCPWAKCTFCTHHHSSIGYRTRRIEDCVEEITCLQKVYNCSLFYFYDEMIPASRFKKLAEKIIAEKLIIRYGAYAKPLKPFSADLCRLLHRSGCRILQWGVEAGSQRILDLMGKGTEIDQVEQVLSNSRKAGIYNLIFVLLGFPSETEDELQQTITFIDRNKDNIHALSTGSFVLSKGARVYREPESFFISRIWEHKKSSILYPALAYEVIQGMTAKEVRRHYRNKQKYFSEISLTRRFGTYREHFLIYGAQPVVK